MSDPIPPSEEPDLLWRRIGAAAIDVTILAVIAIVTATVFRRVNGLAGLITLAYSLGAFVWWQGRTGASPGKQMLGLRVVDATGQPCGPVKAGVRWLLWAVDGFPYCFPAVAFIMIFTNADQRRVGDRVADTWVVDQARVGRRPLTSSAAQELTTGPDPVWDDVGQAYLRTDPVSGRRERFDENTATWTPADD